MTHFSPARAVALIDTAALAHNYKILAAHAAAVTRADPPPRIIAVVKANAYGHGARLVVPTLLDAGCDFFAVATPKEALTVRKLAPFADILILGYSPPHYAAALAAQQITQTVFSAEYARALSHAAKKAGVTVKIHLKVDGGMCRLGFDPTDTAGLFTAAGEPHLSPLGIYTHFPVADTDKRTTLGALSAFLACRAALATNGLLLFAHAAASAALLNTPEAVLDGVRPGLALYGVAPTKTKLPLARVLTLSAPVVQVRDLPRGTPVGYGGTFVTARSSRIGTVAIGYADGIFRAFSGQTVRVLHQNRAFFAPVAGRVCMDQLMLDLTDTPVTVGDRAFFYDDPIATAAALGTIPYELLTAIGERVMRKEQRL